MFLCPAIAAMDGRAAANWRMEDSWRIQLSDKDTKVLPFTKNV